MTNRVQWRRSQLVTLLLALGFGLWFLTPKNVWPTSVDWLSSGDMAFAQNMWQYFRFTPNFQWPITKVPAYGDGWNTIFPSTAGIVLLGLPAKIISPILPKDFQYLGLWTLTSFGLQGFFAEKLFFRLGLREIERVLGAVSLLVAPAFIFRIGMTHLDLAAHWLILAALLVYLSDNNLRSSRSVLVLSLVALLVNIYLFVMIFLVSVATLLKRFLVSNRNPSQVRALIFQLSLLTLTSGLVWWVIGYSSFLGSARGQGFFRMNALAFLNPGYGFAKSFSLARDLVPQFRNRIFFTEEGEGFVYLGIVGVVGLLALLFLILKLWKSSSSRLFLPLAIVASVLFMTALSDRVAVVRREIHLPIPQTMVDARQIFRVANRFSWVAYYLILALGWVAICRLVRRTRIATVLLTMLLAIGVVDQWAGMTSIRASFLSHNSTQTSLKSAEWEAIGTSVSRMYLVPTFDAQADELPPGAEFWLNKSRWADLIAFGADYQLITNFAYVGRPVTKQVKNANHELRGALSRNEFPRDAVLFFADKSAWLKAQASLRAGDRAREVDGLFLIVTTGDGTVNQ